VKLFLSSVIGFLAASPIGPMGLLCLRRTFFQGVSSGLVSALGISTAYLLWAYATIHGVSSVAHWIEQNKHPLEAAIGLLFFLYGLHALYKSRGAACPVLRRKSGPAEFFSTFLVVLLNPSTFVMFTALFTLFGVAKPPPGAARFPGDSRFCLCRCGGVLGAGIPDHLTPPE
jgi:threonine/homoserine/homoserine lactone efflux protein